MSKRKGANASHKQLPKRGNLSWRAHAACLYTDPEIFFNPDHYRQALAVCADCPVQEPCAELGSWQTEGVWGGKITSGTTRYVDNRDYLSQPHGTAAAYRRHFRNGEPPCESCRRGNAQYKRETRSTRGTE